MKRKLVIGALVGILAVTASAPVFAHDGSDSEMNDDRSGRQSGSTITKVEDTVKSTVRPLVNKAESVEDKAKTGLSDDEKSPSLRDELKQMHAESKQKLEGRRLAQCQNRQERINSLVEQGVVNGKQHLANIQQFEARVREFYEKKKLSSESFAVASASVDEKEASAVSALDAIKSESFDCTKVDATKPADTLKAMRVAKHDALKAYRQSVVDLIHVVKAAYAESQTDDQTTEQKPASEGEVR